MKLPNFGELKFNTERQRPPPAPPRGMGVEMIVLRIVS
jgi:hypothetical protein